MLEAAIYFTALAHPSSWEGCVPTDASETVMYAEGQRDCSLIGPNARCGGGIIAENVVQFAGSEAHRHELCGENTWRTKRSRVIGSLVGKITAADPTRPIRLICHNIGWSKWKYIEYYEGSDPSACSTDPDPMASDTLDVAIVGGGLGGSAAYASTQLHAAEAGRSVSVKMYAAASSATTDSSSGVVWFPLHRNASELEQAAPEAPPGAMAKYSVDGKVSHSWWTSHGLQLTAATYPGTADLYWDYGVFSEPKNGGAFSLTGCTPGICGMQINNATRHLGSTSAPDFNTNAVLIEVRRHNQELYRLDFETDLGSAFSVLARAVVLATGGNGQQLISDPDRVLANPENTGVHLDIADEFNLTRVGETLQWGLEFQKMYNPTSSQYEVQARWFAVACAPANVSNYSRCEDYNRRVNSYGPEPQPWYASVSSTGNCTHVGEDKWTSLMALYGVDQYPCDLMEVAPGVIDGKAGFKIGNDMCSTEEPRICAAGTTASHLTGSMYAAPGGTLGWALHSGRIAGETAESRAYAARLAAQSSGGREYKANPAPIFFVAGSWTILVGIVLHIVPSLKQWHYYVMPVGVLLIGLGVLYAARKEDGRSMRDANRLHVRVGYATIIMLLLQVGWGTELKLMDAGYFAQCSGVRRLSGTAHRIFGSITLGLVAYLNVSATTQAKRTALGLYDWHRTASEVAGIIFAVVSGIIILKVFSRLKFSKEKRKQNPLYIGFIDVE